MPRQPRVHFPGAIYHVIARGNNQQAVFQSDGDKIRYLNRLEYYKQKFPYKIFAYVLMNNHIHLIIQVQDYQLSKIMQGIQQSYTIYYNRKYDCSGHVFQQRYKAILCQKDDYLLTLIKYIHLNPVRAGLSPGLEYQWSSHVHYIGKRLGQLVDTDFVMSMLGKNGQSSWQDYSDFMNENIIGNVKEYPDPQNMRDESRESGIFHELLATTAEDYGIDVQLLMQPRTDSYSQQARIAIIKALIMEHNWSQSKVAEYFGLNRSSISKIINRF